MTKTQEAKRAPAISYEAAWRAYFGPNRADRLREREAHQIVDGLADKLVALEFDMEIDTSTATGRQALQECVDDFLVRNGPHLNEVQTKALIAEAARRSLVTIRLVGAENKILKHYSTFLTLTKHFDQEKSNFFYKFFAHGLTTQNIANAGCQAQNEVADYLIKKVGAGFFRAQNSYYFLWALEDLSKRSIDTILNEYTPPKNSATMKVWPKLLNGRAFMNEQGGDEFFESIIRQLNQKGLGVSDYASMPETIRMLNSDQLTIYIQSLWKFRQENHLNYDIGHFFDSGWQSCLRDAAASFSIGDESGKGADNLKKFPLLYETTESENHKESLLQRYISIMHRVPQEAAIQHLLDLEHRHSISFDKMKCVMKELEARVKKDDTWLHRAAVGSPQNIEKVFLYISKAKEIQETLDAINEITDHSVVIHQRFQRRMI